MKRKLRFLMIALLLLFGSKAQSYHAFLNNSSWTNVVVPGFGLPNQYTYYNQGADTIIGSVQYAQITAAGGVNGTYYLREDTVAKRVYQYANTGPEILLYDFSLAVGDTFYINSDTLIVSTVSPVSTTQGLRQQLTLTRASFLYHFVEGVGSIEETMDRVPWTGMDPVYHLVCSYQNSVAMYNSNMGFICSQGPLCYQPVDSLTTGYDANGVTSADFNQDGFEDLATSDAMSHQVSIFLGNGTGGFLSATNYTVSYPAALTSADVNNDNIADILTAGPSGGNILLGVGNGIFSMPQNFSSSINAIASDDFNGDGNPDIVAVNGSGLLVYTGNGSGSFSSFQTFVTGPNPTSIAIADFNSDNKKDVALGIQNGVSILLGNGACSFGSALNIATGGGPTSVTAADFDNDGNMDIAVSNNTWSNSISVLFGNGTGNFTGPFNFTTSSAVNSISSADVNNDANADIIVGCGNLYSPYYPGSIELLLGNGGGLFTLLDTFVVAGAPNAIVCANLNNDGFIDIACATYTMSTTLSVLLTCGTSTVTAGAHAVQDEEANFNIYPVPADNVLYVESNYNAGEIRFTITNAVGQEVLSAKTSQTVNRISMESFPSGLYFFTGNTIQGSFRQKILILH